MEIDRVDTELFAEVNHPLDAVPIVLDVDEVAVNAACDRAADSSCHRLPNTPGRALESPLATQLVIGRGVVAVEAEGDLIQLGEATHLEETLRKMTVRIDPKILESKQQWGADH